MVSLVIRFAYDHEQAAYVPNKGHLRTHAVPLDTSVGAIRWLDSVGTPVGVQQRLMRHSDIRTTMNIYGDAVTPDMREAHDKIVGLALNGTGNRTEQGPTKLKRWWAL